MSLPAKVSGATYEAIWGSLFLSAQRMNGVDVLAEQEYGFGPGTLPAITNGDAAAIAEGWRQAAGRSRASWMLWYELMLGAFGWRSPGDRFVVTEAHRRGLFPREYLPLLWDATRSLARRLDAEGTVVRPIAFDTSRQAWDRAQRDAWNRMKSEGKLPIPGNPDVEPPAPPPPAPPVTGPPVPSFPWWLLLLGGAALLSRRRRRA